MATKNLNLARESVITMAAKFTGAIAGFAGIMIFARVFGPHRLGDYYYLLAIAQAVIQLSGGLAGAAQKRISEVQSNPEEVLGFALLAHLGILVVTVPALTLAQAYLPLDTSTPTKLLYVLGLFAILVGTGGVYIILNSTLAGLGKPARATWINTIRSVLILAGQITFLMSGFGVIGLLLGQAAGSVVGAGILAYITGVRPKLPSREIAVSVVSFSKWSIPSSILSRFYKRADPIIIGALVGGTAVGYYETALRLGMPATLYAASIARPLNVKVSARTSDGESVIQDLRNAVGLCLALPLPLLFGGTALAKPLLTTVYGPDFAGAAPLLVLVLGYYTIHVFTFPFSSALGGANRPDLGFVARLSSILVYTPLAFIGVQKFGAAGVVAATIIGETVQVFVVELATRKVFGSFILPREVVIQVFASVVMFAGVTVLRDMYTISGWIPLLTIVGVGAGIYGVLLTAFSKQFRATIRGVLPAEYKDYVPV